MQVGLCQAEQSSEMKKLVRNTEDDLMKDLIELDKFSGLSEEARSSRKNKIKQLEILLSELDQIKATLVGLRHEGNEEDAATESLSAPVTTDGAAPVTTDDQEPLAPWTVKVSLDGDLRRCRWEPDGRENDFEVICETVSQLFGLRRNSGKCLQLRYKDDDGDLCTLIEPTLPDALKIFKDSRVLRLIASRIAPN